MAATEEQAEAAVQKMQHAGGEDGKSNLVFDGNETGMAMQVATASIFDNAGLSVEAQESVSAE